MNPNASRQGFRPKVVGADGAGAGEYQEVCCQEKHEDEIAHYGGDEKIVLVEDLVTDQILVTDNAIDLDCDDQGQGQKAQDQRPPALDVAVVQAAHTNGVHGYGKNHYNQRLDAVQNVP